MGRARAPGRFGIRVEHFVAAAVRRRKFSECGLIPLTIIPLTNPRKVRGIKVRGMGAAQWGRTSRNATRGATGRNKRGTFKTL